MFLFMKFKEFVTVYACVRAALKLPRRNTLDRGMVDIQVKLEGKKQIVPKWV